MGKNVKGLIGITVLALMSVVLYIIKDYVISYTAQGLPDYLAVMMISFTGAVSIIIPIPYTAIVFFMASIKNLDPLLTAISGGTGSGLGEVTGWILGRFMSKTLESTKYIKQIKALIRLINMTKSRYIVPIIIFVFALTPLPDDILFIALGILRYNLTYALIPCVLGKIVMMYFVALFGRAVSFLGETIGLNEGLITMLSLGLLVMIILLMILVRWDRLLEKYIPH